MKKSHINFATIAIAASIAAFVLSLYSWGQKLESLGGKTAIVTKEWKLLDIAESGNEVQIVPLNNLNLEWEIVTIYTSESPFSVNDKEATCFQSCELATTWNIHELGSDKIIAQEVVSVEAQSFKGSIPIILIIH